MGCAEVMRVSEIDGPQGGIQKIVTIGTHRVAVGDVQRGAVKALVDACDAELADIVYSDPPWGEGNLRYWRTQASDPTRPVWSEFVETWTTSVSAALRRDGALFVEMGLRWEAGFARALEAVGRPLRYRWETQYKAGKKLLPVALLYSGPELRGDFNPVPLRGAALPKACVHEAARAMGLLGLPPVLRGSVLDPCCGKGYTARAAVAAGLHFRGIELNPKRAAVTMNWLSWHGAP
jgi:hypothetical protein